MLDAEREAAGDGWRRALLQEKLRHGLLAAVVTDQVAASASGTQGDGKGVLMQTGGPAVGDELFRSAGDKVQGSDGRHRSCGRSRLNLLMLASVIDAVNDLRVADGQSQGQTRFGVVAGYAYRALELYWRL